MEFEYICEEFQNHKGLSLIQKETGKKKKKIPNLLPRKEGKTLSMLELNFFLPTVVEQIWNWNRNQSWRLLPSSFDLARWFSFYSRFNLAPSDRLSLSSRFLLSLLHSNFPFFSVFLFILHIFSFSHIGSLNNSKMVRF